jgi:uridine kinase
MKGPYQFDHPRAIDFELLVTQLKAENIIHQPVYILLTHNRTEDTVTTHPQSNDCRRHFDFS